MRLLEILKAHPRFGEDFKSDLREPKSPWAFMLGTAAYWPDTARGSSAVPSINLALQLGAALVIGNPPKVPANQEHFRPGRIWPTQDLHIERRLNFAGRPARIRARF